MTVTKIICDRCGAEIEDKHPDRLSVERYCEIDYRHNGYKSTKKMTFCEKCQSDFEKFMKGENE